MRIVSYRQGGGVETGVVLPDGAVVDLATLHARDAAMPRSVTELLAAGRPAMERVERAAADALRQGPQLALTELQLLPPVPHPGKVVCIAGNYAEHLVEWNMPRFSREELRVPWLFLRPPTSLLASGAPLIVPTMMGEPDWELELAAVVGRAGRNLAPTQALQHVAGYTIFNDLYARRLRLPDGRPSREWDKFFEWYEGRCFDGTAPCGPLLVTADEVPDPQSLAMTLWVNGTVRQRSNTAGMLFSVAECLAFASSFMTLEPGDIVSTGTCGGAGLATDDHLRDGDVVEAEIQGLGRQRNQVSVLPRETADGWP